MKSYFFLAGLLAIAVANSCNTRPRYLDLNTTQYVNLQKDSTSGYIMNAKTGEPVDFYVDTKTHDTIYGTTGEVVNGKIEKSNEGRWTIKTDGDEYKAKSESENSAKVKTEGDEYKSKNGNYTIKKDGKGNVKIENGKTQVKVDGKTGQRKVKKDKNVTDKVKKYFTKKSFGQSGQHLCSITSSVLPGRDAHSSSPCSVGDVLVSSFLPSPKPLSFKGSL